MAASSEIRFKIGADTSALSKAFVGAQSVAAAAGARLQKSFGLKDAMKGIFQGIGIGSVSTITDLVVAPFERGAEQAKAMAAMTGDLLGQTLRYIGVVGGATKQLEQQAKQVNELNRDIAAQRQLVADLNANKINLLTPGGRAAITEAETGLNTLIAKQAEIATTVQIAVLDAVERVLRHHKERTPRALRRRGEARANDGESEGLNCGAGNALRGAHVRAPDLFYVRLRRMLHSESASPV